MNSMKKIVFLVLICLLAGSLFGQRNAEVIEITKTDITLYPTLTSNQISVFGIRIGMTKREVNEMLSENSNLYYYEDKSHSTPDHRVYVYDKDRDGKKQNCILYLIWSNGKKDLDRITFFEGFESYLVGKASKLLTLEESDDQSNFFHEYLGDPSSSAITLEVPMIGVKHTTYYYDAKGIEVTFKEESSYGATTVVFAFTKMK